MSVQITCDNCGAENRLGTIFCRSCGARLNLKAAEPGKAKHRGAPDIGKLLARLIRLVILLALLVVLGMLCWGMPMPGDEPSDNGTAFVEAKMNALRGAILRRNEVVDMVAEKDINAYINGRIVSTESGGGLSVTLEQVSLDFQEDKIVAWMSTKLGPIPLTQSVETSLSRGANGRFDFAAGEVRIGHLPLPSFLKGRVTGQFTTLFSQFDQEYNLLNRLAHVEPVDGGLEVGTVTR